MHIRDIRVGMRLIFGQEKLRMTKGKAYEVVAIKDVHQRELGIVEVLDDVGVKRDFYARRFERIAEDVPAHKFQVGDEVKNNWDRRFIVTNVLANGFVWLQERDKHWNNHGDGFYPDKFDLVKRANAPAAAPQPKAIIKLEVGNHVKVVKQFNGTEKCKWNADMNNTIGKVYKIEAYDDWAKSYQLSNGWMYMAEALELAKEEDIKMAKKKVAKKPTLRDLIAQSRKEDIGKCTFVSSFVVFVKNNKTGAITLNKNLAGPCHAQLAQHYGRDEQKEAVAVIDYQQEHIRQVEQRAGKEFIPSYKKFVDYIVNRSPWAVAFQGKTAKNVLENGVLMNVEAPSGAVAGGCMALRHLAEFAIQNATWKLMMDNGIQEDAAFLTMYAFTKGEGNTYTKNAMGGGHQAIAGDISAGSLISFFANGYNEEFLKSEPYRTKTSYRVHEHIEGVQDVLGIVGQYTTYVQENVAWKKTQEGWAQVYSATEEQVLKFARHLEQQINKARESKVAA